ncbi:MAG: SET domain-containing protein-lysine N-methyltransferase [Acidiferrobacterales bacterium]|nr:SET domain-containing protein-lysine N-methyltransferase [Acidiferrobacterales bacterium]
MQNSHLGVSKQTLSVQNSIISGMFLSTTLEVERSPFSIHKGKQFSSNNTIELVKSITPWTPNYLLNKSPIIQSPKSPLEPHPLLEQPENVDFGRTNDFFSIEKHRCKKVYQRALTTMDTLLKDNEARRAHEAKYFELATVGEDNISFIPKNKRHLNTTIGIRGTVAKTTIPAGTPLIYSAQYLNEDQWVAAIAKLGTHLQSVFRLEDEEAAYDALRRLTCYAYRPHKFESEKYYTPAYGAGNICAMINHDDEFNNMASVYVPMLDAYQNPSAGVYMFFSLGDIQKGEQLLVNYGDKYVFDPVYTERVLIESFADESSMAF